MSEKNTYRQWVKGKGYYIFKSRKVYMAYCDRDHGERGLMFSLEKKIKESENNETLKRMFFGKYHITEIPKAKSKIKTLRDKYGDIV